MFGFERGMHYLFLARMFEIAHSARTRIECHLILWKRSVKEWHSIKSPSSSLSFLLLFHSFIHSLSLSLFHPLPLPLSLSNSFIHSLSPSILFFQFPHLKFINNDFKFHLFLSFLSLLLSLFLFLLLLPSTLTQRLRSVTFSLIEHFFFYESLLCCKWREKKRKRVERERERGRKDVEREEEKTERMREDERNEERRKSCNLIPSHVRRKSILSSYKQLCLNDASFPLSLLFLSFSSSLFLLFFLSLSPSHT